MTFRKRKKMVLLLGATRALVFLALVLTVSLLAAMVTFGHENSVASSSRRAAAAVDTFQTRLSRLKEVCRKYSDPFRPESASVSQPASGLGVEVVYLVSESVRKSGTVCLPHKVASHSWGKFARRLKEAQGPEAAFALELEAMSWEKRALISHRAVIVRHPMERLVSVYRMIFQNWCDPDRFLAKQWSNVCNYQPEEDDADRPGQVEQNAHLDKQEDFSVTKVLTALLDEHQHGNDRFMRALWQHFHPGERLIDPTTQLRFSFKEFAQILINGSSLVQGTRGHQGLSYHWAPYWKECSLCDPQLSPDYILRLESFEPDLDAFLGELGLRDQTHLFPHTHDQGSQPDLVQQLFASLSRDEVWQLYELYKLDHQMFGYEIEPYLSYAQP